MERKITYIAFDGTEFDLEEACLKYEKNNSLKGLRFYNDIKKPILISATDFTRGYNLIYFVLADSFEALDRFNEVCDVYGLDTIPYADLGANYDDLFYWDEDNESWRALRQDMKWLKEVADHFQIFYEDI